MGEYGAIVRHINRLELQDAENDALQWGHIGDVSASAAADASELIKSDRGDNNDLGDEGNPAGGDNPASSDNNDLSDDDNPAGGDNNDLSDEDDDFGEFEEEKTEQNLNVYDSSGLDAVIESEGPDLSLTSINISSIFGTIKSRIENLWSLKELTMAQSRPFMSDPSSQDVWSRLSTLTPSHVDIDGIRVTLRTSRVLRALHHIAAQLGTEGRETIESGSPSFSEDDALVAIVKSDSERRALSMLGNNPGLMFGWDRETIQQTTPVQNTPVQSTPAISRPSTPQSPKLDGNMSVDVDDTAATWGDFES